MKNISIAKANCFERSKLIPGALAVGALMTICAILFILLRVSFPPQEQVIIHAVLSFFILLEFVVLSFNVVLLLSKKPSLEISAHSINLYGMPDVLWADIVWIKSRHVRIKGEEIGILSFFLADKSKYAIPLHQKILKGLRPESKEADFSFSLGGFHSADRAEIIKLISQYKKIVTD